jgi:4-alpha-glucanotransferase
MEMVRSSGILMHVTSLPSAFGIGDLGPESYRFADLLSAAKQRWWSILPLSPTRLEDGNSPYQTSSAFAGNHLLISPELLIEEGFLLKEYKATVSKATSKVNYPAVYTQKATMLDEAYTYFKKKQTQATRFQNFCQKNQQWLNDYALYTALRKATGKPWHQWQASLRRREPEAIARKAKLFAEMIECEKFAQYLFFTQWSSLKDYCRTKQISILGDMPFYMAHDSADVWVHQDLFNLNKQGKPHFVGGVPPDYFSPTGQLWGNPTYNWQQHQQTGFRWWINRIHHNLTLCDKLRFDHFRGFVAFWQVPARANTAKNGKWIKTPSAAFFEKVKSAFHSLPFVAEDLGDIDAPVREAIKHLGIPGMKVLLFGLDGNKDNPHVPQNHMANAVAYTGTHDTNTIKGWFTKEASAKEKQNLFRLVGRRVLTREVSFEVARLAQASVAELCVVPFQDVLGLGAETRMNNPAKSGGNWVWRATKKQLENRKLTQIELLGERYCRAS